MIRVRLHLHANDACARAATFLRLIAARERAPHARKHTHTHAPTDIDENMMLAMIGKVFVPRPRAHIERISTTRDQVCQVAVCACGCGWVGICQGAWGEGVG